MKEKVRKSKEIVVIVVTRDILVICKNECDYVTHRNGREDQWCIDDSDIREGKHKENINKLEKSKTWHQNCLSSLEIIKGSGTTNIHWKENNRNEFYDTTYAVHPCVIKAKEISVVEFNTLFAETHQEKWKQNGSY